MGVATGMLVAEAACGMGDDVGAAVRVACSVAVVVGVTEDYDTWHRATAECEELAEVQIMRLNDVGFLAGLCHDLLARQPLQPEFMQMNSLETQLAEERSALWRYTHVPQKPHVCMPSKAWTDSSASQAA